MKYMHNPFTGEVKLATPLNAKRLRHYGWEDTTYTHWREYRQATVERAVMRMRREQVQ